MPEYLSPGVYVEETSFRAKSIEGVATSTVGLVGQTRFGPPSDTPMLVTSYEEHTRYFGDDADILAGGAPRLNHMAHAVRLFFLNGGARAYISRIVVPAAGLGYRDISAVSVPLVTTVGSAYLRARYPGLAGNLTVAVQATRGGNLRIAVAGSASIAGVRAGDVVELSNVGTKPRRVGVSGSAATADSAPLTTVAGEIGAVSFNSVGRPVVTASTGVVDLSTFTYAQKVTLSVQVLPNGDGTTGTRADQIQNLSAHPDSLQYIGLVLRTQDWANAIEPPADQSNRIWCDAPTPPADAQPRAGFAVSLLRALVDQDTANNNLPFVLTGGAEGNLAGPADYTGQGSGHDVTGLVALATVEDIALVAAPGSAALDTDDDRQGVRDALIAHCEGLKYRFAVMAAQQDADLAAVREARGKHDSSYAALYYPWLVAPATSGSRDTMQLSPEGAVLGVYARTDIERGVFKAPANETVLGVLRFSHNVNKGEQDVLNPEGINCLRFFEGRGNRVWGARTMSSDLDWIYVNVRRLFIYLEHSIDRGTQWAVFEPNNEQLWLKIRLTIESFLYDTWRSGALMGTKPEQAYFVRCDRTTMSQSDLDNGRLICLIGVAPTKPAEFVIFRIGQWTADASII
jgi:phage tail sheath protein FI